MSVHFFLTGGHLTWQYRRALTSARVHGEPIVLWYTSADEWPVVPKGIKRRFARLPDWLAEAHPQTKFNYLALVTMYTYGGMAFGLDSISLEPAHGLLDGKQLAVARGFPADAEVAHPFQTDYVAQPGAEVIPGMVAELERRVREQAHVDMGVTEGGATGPLLLTEPVLGNPDTVAQAPFPTLCGWEFAEAWRFYEGEPPGPDVRVIQLYASGYPELYERLPA